MKTVVKISMVALMATSMLQAERVNRYVVKSGKVTYDITGSKEIKFLHTKEITKGKKRVIFDDHGNREIVETNKITKSKTQGKSTVEKEHELTYTNGIDQYNVDFDRKRIIKRKNPYYAANYTLVDGKNIQAYMPKAKKSGTENVAGAECTVWKTKNESMCIYKGIILKHFLDGETTTATKVELDKALGHNDFKLPDFPLYDRKGKRVSE